MRRFHSDAANPLRNAAFSRLYLEPNRWPQSANERGALRPWTYRGTACIPYTFRTMLQLCHGGHLDARRTRLFASVDYEYAAAYADAHEADVWLLQVKLRESEILDVTACGLDARAVASTLIKAGLPAASIEDDETDSPQCALRGVPDSAIRAAGYRAVRLCEATDWGHPIHTGPIIRNTVALCLVDLSAIVKREVVPNPLRQQLGNQV